MLRKIIHKPRASTRGEFQKCTVYGDIFAYKAKMVIKTRIPIA